VLHELHQAFSLASTVLSDGPHMTFRLFVDIALHVNAMFSRCYSVPTIIVIFISNGAFAMHIISGIYLVSFPS